MNIKVISVLFVISVTRIDGLLQNTGNGLSTRQIDTCTVPQITCSNDFTKIAICIGRSTLYIKCPANRPFCVNGACMQNKGTIMQNSGPSNFLCPGAGYFAEPLNCSRYHVCEKKGAPSIPSQCPDGLIFNSKTGMCLPGVPRTDHASKRICRSISCDASRNETIVFPANPVYYINCTNVGGVQSVTTHKCNDHEIFDVSKERCDFKCKSKGYFANPVNCTKYYVCVGFIHYESIAMDCPIGFFFNGTVCAWDMAHCSVPPTEPTNRPIEPTEPTTYPGPPIDMNRPNSTESPPYVGPPIDMNRPNSTESPPYEGPPTYEGPPIYEGPQFGDVSHESAAETLALVPVDSLIKKSPIFPLNSLWKHKGKYSIRIGK